MSVITAAVLIIGNEILSGKTREANMHWLSSQLNEMGIQLRECAIVRDDEAAIISTVQRLSANYKYVFSSGGIGPTHDDITSATMAKAFGTKLQRHPEADKILRAYYSVEQQTDARMKMADIPLGASLIANPVSQAPGYQIQNLYVMAGIPAVFQAMFEQIRPSLKGGSISKTRTLTAYVREGDFAAALTKLDAQFEMVEIGSYPFSNAERFGTQLVFTSTQPTFLNAAVAQCCTLLQSLSIPYE